MKPSSSAPTCSRRVACRGSADRPHMFSHSLVKGASLKSYSLPEGQVGEDANFSLRCI